MADLLIFDYSGTLSLEATRFGQEPRLFRELEETGLAELGIDTGRVFWQEIVEPTWDEGSRTPLGYEKVLVRRLRDRLGQGAAAEKIARAAAAFVRRYLAACSIDEGWRELLVELKGKRGVSTLIATDHYAEATEAIRGFLGLWSIAAAPLARRPSQATGERGGAQFLIANSADLGAWKQERRFWELVQGFLSPYRPERILVVDDFGRNEDSQDPYADAGKIASRQEAMLANIRETFQVPVECLCFSIGQTPVSELAGLIGKVAARIRAFLEKGR